MQFLIDNADLLPNYFTSEDQIPPLPGSDDEDEAPVAKKAASVASSRASDTPDDNVDVNADEEK